MPAGASGRSNVGPLTGEVLGELRDGGGEHRVVGRLPHVDAASADPRVDRVVGVRLTLVALGVPADGDDRVVVGDDRQLADRRGHRGGGSRVDGHRAVLRGRLGSDCPQVVHGVGAPRPPPFGGAGGEIERGERLTHAEVGVEEHVGIAEAAHHDVAGRPRPDAADGAQPLDHLGAVDARRRARGRRGDESRRRVGSCRPGRSASAGRPASAAASRSIDGNRCVSAGSPIATGSPTAAAMRPATVRAPATETC